MAINFRVAKNESRVRDKKRHRYLLQIGGSHFHVTKTEARKLYRQIERLVWPNTDDHYQTLVI